MDDCHLGYIKKSPPKKKHWPKLETCFAESGKETSWHGWSLESACHLRLCAVLVFVEEAIAHPHTFHHMLMQPIVQHSIIGHSSDFTNIFQVDEILTSIVVTLLTSFK